MCFICRRPLTFWQFDLCERCRHQVFPPKCLTCGRELTPNHTCKWYHQMEDVLQANIEGLTYR